MGIFRIPSSARQQVRPIGTGRLYREVASYEQITAALNELSSRVAAVPGNDLAARVAGGQIHIVAPFNIPESIYIPPKCIGLTITSAGYIPITPRVALDEIFLVDAVAVSIVGVLGYAKSTSVFAETFARIGPTAFAGDDLRIEQCITVCDRVVVDEEGSSNVFVHRNIHEAVTSTGECPITCDGGGSFWSITSNKLSAGGALEAIRCANGGGSHGIHDNYVDGIDIDTFNSGGLNTISGNRGLGTTGFVVPDATDVQAANV